jgi:uncharacterized membrane protein HdeD (DUF308 family)
MATITPIAGSDVRYWWIFLLRALLFLIAGFLTVRYPIESYVALSIFFGVTMLLTGIIELVYAISHRKEKGWGWRLFAAIVDLILWRNPRDESRAHYGYITILRGLWFLFRGITLISFSGIVRDTGNTAWMIVGGILLIIVAALIMIHPAIGALTIITWTAIGFFAAGIFNIILAFQLKGVHGSMNFNKSLILAGLSLILGFSCSQPAHVQKDPSANLSNYRTYMWVEAKISDQDNAAAPIASIDLSVRNKVNQELAKRGWKEVTENPDVLISYEVLVERSIEERTNPVYTRPLSRFFYNPYKGRWITVYYPSQFIGYDTYQVPVKEATIMLTLIDTKTEKVVWQGWTTDRLNYAKITDKEIEKSLNNIFRKLA